MMFLINEFTTTTTTTKRAICLDTLLNTAIPLHPTQIHQLQGIPDSCGRQAFVVTTPSLFFSFNVIPPIIGEIENVRDLKKNVRCQVDVFVNSIVDFVIV